LGQGHRPARSDLRGGRRPLKIAHVTLRFDAPGGVETNVLEVTRGLKAKGDEVEVFASDLYDESRWERRTDFAPVKDGVAVHRFPVYKRLVPGLTMPMMTGLIRALDEAHPDVIHAHSHRYGHVLEAAAVAQARGIPFVVSTHYHPADRREPPWKRGMLRVQDVGFGATAYRVADALVVETQLEADLVGEFAPSDRIRIIPPGIALEDWELEGTAPSGKGLPPRYLLYTGRVAPNKGLATLIEALSLLPPAQRLPLVVMGPDWGERTRLEALATARGVAENVIWLGLVESSAEFRAVYRGATIFVLPSEWEAFGLVLLGAMAAGVPIIATSVGGVPEVLENGRSGLLVRFGDANALAEAIRTLANDPVKRASLVDAGRRRVRDFTWTKAVDRHRALYRELADGRR
jgi:glycosyltransferase involved in cell wall biosynthesis